MNKKIIIGLVVAGLVIAGGVYLYNRNKKATDKKNNMATEKDALEVIDLLGKKDTPYTTEQVSKFVPIYTSSIDKDTHKNILTTISKKEAEWSAQDKLYSAQLIQVVNKLK
jgi:predicted nucleic acid-binding protein